MYHRLPPRLAVMLFALIVPLLLAQPLSVHAADAQCFQETGQCMSGQFRSYWQGNGGLPIFGFPITGPADEISRDTDKSYRTQWFERNRLEIHPENAAPYDVLLGRLGDDRLRQEGRDWRTLPKADPGTVHYYAETGHAIAPQFWSYWRSHGLAFGDAGVSERESLALFGLPLSEPTMETNASGDTVLTQWFERARFEYHPAEPAPYTVLLGLLGDEIQAARMPHTLTKTASLGSPVVAGHYAFWADIRNRPAGTNSTVQLFGYDIDRRSEFVITPTPAAIGQMASDGATLVWEEPLFGDQPHDRLQGYSLQTKQTFTVLETASLNVLGSLAMSDGILYYVDTSANHRGIFGRTLATGQEYQLNAAVPTNLIASDGILLWSEPQGCQPMLCPARTLLHMLKLDGHSPDTVIAQEEGASGISGLGVSGNYIAWAFVPPARDPGVHLYRISDQQTLTLSPASSYLIQNVVINGNHIVWKAGPSTWTLNDYRIAEGSIRTLAQGEAVGRSFGIVEGTTLVYMTGQNELSIVNLE
ncbi:MAG: hypothetical protein NVS2B7_38990 [Herpetosiphon sp.]